MIWLFALGVIALAVYNRGFRLVLLWTSPIWLIAIITALG